MFILNISPINVCKSYHNDSNFSKSSYNPNFTGRSTVLIEKGLQSCEYSLRVIVNKLVDIFEGKQIKEATKLVSEIVPESTEKYLAQLDDISRWFATNKSIDVNIEDKILERVAKEGKSTIFIMNHSNQKEDPSLLAVLNTLLTEAYIAAGRGKEKPFPLPKIILNEDILTSMNKTKRKAFEAFGAVGVDANLASANKETNVRAFVPIMRDFLKDKCNIFIFPEGKLAIRNDLSLEERFQSGIAELISKILGVKKEVTVVPVGFSYGKGDAKKLVAMQIGKPVVFTRQGDITTSTAGSILESEFAFKGFKDFFKKHEDKTDVPITKEGVPVPINGIVGFIKSILCENLGICAKEAAKKLKEPLNAREIKLY